MRKPKTGQRLKADLDSLLLIHINKELLDRVWGVIDAASKGHQKASKFGKKL